MFNADRPASERACDFVMQKRPSTAINTLPIPIVLPSALLALVLLSNASFLPRHLALCTVPSWHLLAGFTFTSSRHAMRARFAALLPSFLVAICLHAILQSSSLRHPFATPLLSLILPYLPKDWRYPPTSEPLPLPMLIPGILISAAAFPTLLEVLPQSRPGRALRLKMQMLVALFFAFVAKYQSLSNSYAVVNLFEMMVYIPFKIHLPAFIAGILLARIHQSEEMSTNPPGPHHGDSTRTTALKVCSVFCGCLMAGVLALPQPVSEYKAELLLIPLCALILCTSKLSADLNVDTRYTPALSETHAPVSHANELQESYVLPELECAFLFGLSVYVCQNFVWRILADVLCADDGGSVPSFCVRSFPEWLGSAEQSSRAFPFRSNLRPAFSIFGLTLGLVSCTLCYTVLRLCLHFLQSESILSKLRSVSVLPTWYTGVGSPCLDASDHGTQPSRRPTDPPSHEIDHPHFCSFRRRIGRFEAFCKCLLYVVGCFSLIGFIWFLNTPLTYRRADKGIESYLCAMTSGMLRCLDPKDFDAEEYTRVKSPVYHFVLDVLRWVSLLCLPVLLCNVVGHMLFPRILWRTLPAVQHMLSASNGRECATSADLSDCVKDLDMNFTLFIRYVTRGNNPRLVARNARDAEYILRQSGLPESKYVVEIVTDKPLNHGSDDALNQRVVEIVVPSWYKTPHGALFKARALNYAIGASSARDFDWIVHLDEETRFDFHTVAAILLHCGKETHAVRVAQSKQWPNIGQGPILFGQAMSSMAWRQASASTCQGNWITTLADSSRVSDDCGRFRVQYEFGEMWAGMHGSFVVAANCVEKHITFDHGVEGSIAEDAFFALLARSRTVRFSWIDAFMYEQSPFTFADFVKQRARWLVGGIMACRSEKIPWRARATMGSLLTLWSLMPFTILALIATLILEQLEPLRAEDRWYFGVLLPLTAATSLWSYVLGFFVSYSVRDLGLFRFITLLYLQIVLAPVFGAMEVSGVMYGLWNFEQLSVCFHIVQKDGDCSQDFRLRSIDSLSSTSDKESSVFHRRDECTPLLPS